MKRLMSILLALVMVLGLSTTALASDTSETLPTTTTYSDTSTVALKKTYSITNSGTMNPAETFSFTVTKYSVSDSQITDKDKIPTISASNISYTAGEATMAGDTNEVTITLPSTTEFGGVGVYTYEIAETAGSTAGVVYDTQKIYLVVTVLQQGDDLVRVAALHYGSVNGSKTDNAFKNVYNAGSLSITKTVEGNLGDRDQYFEFKVTLTGSNVGSTIGVSGGSYSSNPTSITVGQETTFYLKHGETLTLSNIPYGVTYTVTETAVTGYTTTKTGDTGTINSDSATAAFTNTKGQTIDTGITMDSMPYIVLMVACVVGLGLFVVSKKRRVE